MSSRNAGFALLFAGLLSLIGQGLFAPSPGGTDEIDQAVLEIEEGIRSVYAEASVRANSFANSAEASRWLGERHSAAIEIAVQPIKDRQQAEIGSEYNSVNAAKLWKRWGEK